MDFHKYFSNIVPNAASDLALGAGRGKELAQKSWSSQGPTRSCKRPGGSHHQTRSQGHPHSPQLGHFHSENITTDLAGCKIAAITGALEPLLLKYLQQNDIGQAVLHIKGFHS